MGYDSLQGNTTGASNVAIGVNALRVNTTAGNNVAVGSNALAANTTGADNTSVGDSSMIANTTGSNNTALGGQALDANTTADNNTAVGRLALTNNTGSNNTALGASALQANTSADNNTAVGFQALEAVNGAGHSNTSIGFQAGATTTTGDANVFIGFQAGKDKHEADNNTLWVARASADPGNAGMWIYGQSNGSCIQGNNATAWTQSSDERIKKDIVDSSKGLAKIDAIQVRNFNFRTQDEVTVDGLKTSDAPGLQTGVIAQEIESVLPEAVTENSKGQKAVTTDPIFWAMVKAIQELSAKNDALLARIETLEG